MWERTYKGICTLQNNTSSAPPHSHRPESTTPHPFWDWSLGRNDGWERDTGKKVITTIFSPSSSFLPSILRTFHLLKWLRAPVILNYWQEKKAVDEVEWLAVRDLRYQDGCITQQKPHIPSRVYRAVLANQSASLWTWTLHACVQLSVFLISSQRTATSSTT